METMPQIVGVGTYFALFYMYHNLCMVANDQTMYVSRYPFHATDGAGDW